MRSIGALILCGVLLGPFVSSFLDAGFVSLNHFGEQGYWQVWTMRFCSNVFTALTLVPVLVTWGTAPPELYRALQPVRAFEASIAILALIAVNVLVFVWEGNGPMSNPAWLYAPLPFLLWSAVRFGVGGTSTGILSVAILAIWGAVHGRGPFTSHSPEQNAFAIQIFFGVISTPLLFLAASIAERGKAEERFTRVFRSSPDAMLITRLKDRRIIDVNERWEQMLGHRREESIGHTLSELNIFATPADGERLAAGTSSGERLHELELCLCTRPGELRHALISADSDDIAGERCVITIIRDITDRKRAEEAQQNLAHVSRLAVVGELTAMVAHEVNQPLGAILSNADAAEILLQSENPPLKEIREILADIRKNDLRADEAIRRIRSLLRKREMQMHPFDLNETVTDVLRLVAGDVLRRRVVVQRHLSAQLPPVIGDRVSLQQVLLNLIVNGMDAMAETAEAERTLTLQSRLNGDGGVEVAVSDRGHGVPAQKLARIFDSFFTTKKEGMGLGLSIARSIIEAHRGRIWAENNPGGGASLRFTVPIAASTGQGNAPRL
jgi:PAS domain S-box-containing protein